MGKEKDEVLCDAFVEYKPMVRGVAVMKRDGIKSWR